MPLLAAHTLLISIVALSILLMLLRPRNIPQVYWVGAGALLLVLTRLIPLSLAGRAIAKGTDVYLFLAGMMLLSELAREQGVFDWIASVAVHHARGSDTRLFALLYLAGVAVTFIVLRLYFRRDLTSAVDASSDPVTLTTDGELVLIGLALMVAVLLTASAFGKDLGLPTFIAAVIITAILLIRTRCSPTPLLKQISWSTLALVAALFILVEAMQSIGALTFTEHALLAAQHLAAPIGAPGIPGGRFLPAGVTLAVGFTVAIANNLLNNLPVGLIAANTLTFTHTKGLLR